MLTVFWEMHRLWTFLRLKLEACRTSSTCGFMRELSSTCLNGGSSACLIASHECLTHSLSVLTACRDPYCESDDVSHFM